VTYTAIKASELGVATYTGSRTMVYGAYTIDGNGRKVRAFSARNAKSQDVAYAEALAWAEHLNLRNR
jgi:hypothetical protein